MSVFKLAPAPDERMRHPLQLRGTLEAFTDGIEDSYFLDLSKTEVFMYSWLTGERGWGTRAEFGITETNKQISAEPQPARVSVKGVGSFDMNVELDSEGTSELLKLQGAMRLTDDESGSRRTVTVATGAAALDSILQGQTVSCEIRDPFSPGNCMKLSLKAVGPIPTVPLKPSALRHIPEYNMAVMAVSQRVQSDLSANQIQVPPGGEMFVSGLTSFEFGGCVTGDGTRIDSLSTHYAIMGAQEKLWNRTIPPAIVLYSLYLRLNHSGLTMDQILKAPLLQRATLFLSGVGMTFDAATVPYVRDFCTGICLSMISGLGITEKTTENMALPCGAPQFLGRHIKPAAPIQAPDGLSLDEYVGMLKGRPENLRCILSDDCESSAGMAVLALTSLVEGLQRTPDLQALCAGFEPLFAAWGQADWDAMGGFVHDMAGLVRAGQLTLTTAIGIATNAAASDGDAPGPDSYNGHCHNIGRLAVEGQPIQCFIVEGTAPMELCRVTPTSPRVTCKVASATDPSQTTLERMDMPDFLTRLGKTVSVMTQLVNKPYGAQTGSDGWPLPEPMTGWVSSTIYSNTLDSDPSCALKFYNRVMYAGWACASNQDGCLPVQESAQHATGKVAGCHPYDLNRTDLRAVGVGLDPDMRAKMRAILDEANPPIAEKEVFQKLAATWGPAQPLRAMNQANQRSLEKGVEYLIVSCMESPSSQDYSPVILKIKEPFVREWDRLNRTDPKSDGIRLSIEQVGTGTTIKLRVPQRDIGELTVIRNGVKAMQALGWKGKLFALNA